MSQRNTEQREHTQPNEDRRQGEIKTYDRWQLFYLDRLHRLFELNRDEGALDEDEVRILRRAIFSTLLDCELVGVGEEAKKTISVDG